MDISNKKDILLLVIFTITSLLFKPTGIEKYIILSVISVLLFIYNRGNKKEYYIILTHAFVYISIGLLFALINNCLSYETLKQALLYLSSGFIAINYFSFYGEENTQKLMDLQLYGMCIGYTILYVIFHKGLSLTWESHIYAFIFGFFVLAYICQKKYLQAVIAIVFMIVDNKRIADLALFASLILVLVFALIRNDKYRKIFYMMCCVLLVVAPVVWIYLNANNILTDVLGITDSFATWRFSIWKSIEKYYEFSPLYLGKGLGWVLSWMSKNGIFGLKNLHNDFLTAYIELGFIGYIVWLLSFVIMHYRIEKTKGLKYACISIVFFAYMFVNFLTDNIYIYISFLLPFYIVVLSLLYGHDGCEFLKIIDNKK